MPRLPPVALVLFGDSWVNSEDGYIDTWPELLGQGWGRRTLNLATPSSGSVALGTQLKRLEKMVEHGEELDAEAIAIVHTGGNDLYFSSPLSLVAVAGVGAVGGCCCTLPCQPMLARSLSANLRALVAGLAELGIRHVVLVGVPLTARMPFIPDAMASLGLPGGMTGANRLLHDIGPGR